MTNDCDEEMVKFFLNKINFNEFRATPRLFLFLLGFVLFVNLPIIHFDLMYAEQPNIYLVNQSIYSLADILKIYLHPLLLDNNIPFFRPSGHFLIYQLLAPLLGWHNTKGFIIVNLVFLTLVGVMLIKLYQLLFPRLQTGGYIAFALYLMAPALSLSRLITLHFEFAYVFFVTLGLYCFILFCKKNHFLEEYNYYSCEIKKIKLHHCYLVGFAMLAFCIAVTFKEPAIMLGPLLVVYLIIALYQQPLSVFFKNVLQNKEIMQLVVLLGVTTFVLLIYLTLPWDRLANPAKSIKFGDFVLSTKKFLNLIFATSTNITPNIDGTYHVGEAVRQVIIPSSVRYILWFLYVLSALTLIFMRNDLTRIALHYQKSLLFLILGFFLFFILPMLWSAGMPWHLSLSLVCLSLIMGFSFEYVCRLVVKPIFWRNLICAGFAFVVGLSAITVNQANISFFSKTPEGFQAKVDYNAVLRPPNLKSLLNAESVLVVEDSLNLGDYALGNGLYPFILLNFSYNDFREVNGYYYLKYQPRYNGDLFRWAYLMPNLKEELFPFQVDNMKKLPNEAIHSWLSHINNIFCVGYDKQGVWHDKTALFKKNLLIENKRRHLLVNSYRALPYTAMMGKNLYDKSLAIPDSQLCQLQCDQDIRCKGFTFIDVELKNHSQSKCHYYRSMEVKSAKPCKVCSVYIKNATTA